MQMKEMMRWLLLAALLAGSRGALAVLTIEITQGMEGASPIAIVPFATPAGVTLPEDIAGIISANLRRSGRFAPLPEADLIARPREAADVRFQDWRVLGVGDLVIGRVLQPAPGRYEVQFQLFDVFRSRQLTGYSIPARPDELRRVAHRISDLIYETLTGEPGAFDTRIAYVTAEQGAEGKRYALQVADSDGHNSRTVLRSPQPLMSPAWSSDGQQLAYVSFEGRKAAIYVQDVGTGARREVAAFDGINGAPAWSPDGRRLAVTLSRDGNPEIYVLHLADKRLQRLTNNAAIDTEPAWSPDGNHLVFTSDRGGAPQLYRMDSRGGNVERLSFEGNYNAGADYSADGKRLTLVHRDGRNYRIAVLELDSKRLRVLTDGSLDESPSFAPNGSMIIYATSVGGRGVLAAVSADGRFRQRLTLSGGDVREPAWSPVLRR
jgi:TolB protein